MSLKKMKHISQSINESLQLVNEAEIVNESTTIDDKALKVLAKEVIKHYAIKGSTTIDVKEDDNKVVIDIKVDMQKNLKLLSSTFGTAILRLAAKKSTLNTGTKRPHLAFDASLEMDSNSIALETMLTFFADDSSITIID